MIKGYEMVLGLEVHAELMTDTKIFCGCSTAFGAAPNTQCCPVCMGLPGALPVLNGRVVEYAVTAGLATGCAIAAHSKLDRKNYFYPDLPKAYQISQYDRPLCSGGHLTIETPAGSRCVGITRIHIEEDAGKLVHTADGRTLCDYNRCGVPLIEIVSEPDMRSAAEAVAYVRKLRSILMYAGVCDGKMQEGSLRCDVNLSVRKAGSSVMGTRTEMKNLNSFRFIEKAIEYEAARQCALLEGGESIVQETRRFDPQTGKTYAMRGKENANDYRYFPDPDLPEITVSKAQIDKIAARIPALPDERKARYVGAWGLSPADAEVIAAEKDIADYYESAAALCASPKTLCNLITSEAFRLLGTGETRIPIAPARLARLADMLAEGRINAATAKKLLGELWQADADPEALAEVRGLWQIRDRAALTRLARQAVDENTKSAADYRAGKTQALQALVGRAMGKAGGLADAAQLAQIIRELLGE